MLLITNLQRYVFDFVVVVMLQYVGIHELKIKAIFTL